MIKIKEMIFHKYDEIKFHNYYEIIFDISWTHTLLKVVNHTKK